MNTPRGRRGCLAGRAREGSESDAQCGRTGSNVANVRWSSAGAGRGTRDRLWDGAGRQPGIDCRQTGDTLICYAGVDFASIVCCTALDDGLVEIFNILKIIFRSLPGAREDYRSLSRYLTSPRLSCPVASVIQHARTSAQDGTPAPLPLQLCRASPSLQWERTEHVNLRNAVPGIASGGQNRHQSGCYRARVWCGIGKVIGVTNPASIRD